METIGAFLYNYLEYVIATVGGMGFVIYLSTKKTYDNSNDLTPYIVKLGRQKDAINKQTK
jgi:hypothetical protein